MSARPTCSAPWRPGSRPSGVKPEMEVFELGHVWQAKTLVEEGLIEAPPLFQLCMGIPYGAEADPRAVLAMRDLLPAGAVFAAFGIGRMQMPMVAQAVLMGGHVRVGLEDNLWLDKGVYASNGDLVTARLRDRPAAGRARARAGRRRARSSGWGPSDGRPQGGAGRRRRDRRRLGGAADRERASTWSCATPIPRSSARSARCWPTPTGPMPS